MPKLGLGLGLSQPVFPGELLAPAYAWWAGDFGITKDGFNAVSQWNDKTGNGRALTVPSGYTTPFWYSSVMNSKPGVYFPYYNSGLSLENDTTTIKSIISVVRTAPNLDGVRCIVEAGGGSLYAPILVDPKAGIAEFGSYYGGIVPFGSVTVTTNYILGTQSEGGETAYGYLNNSTAIFSESYGYSPRNDIIVGNDSSQTQCFYGTICELILFDTYLNETQIQAYISLMHQKYFVAGGGGSGGGSGGGPGGGGV